MKRRSHPEGIPHWQKQSHFSLSLTHPPFYLLKPLSSSHLPALYKTLSLTLSLILSLFEHFGRTVALNELFVSANLICKHARAISCMFFHSDSEVQTSRFLLNWFTKATNLAKPTFGVHAYLGLQVNLVTNKLHDIRFMLGKWDKSRSHNNTQLWNETKVLSKNDAQGTMLRISSICPFGPEVPIFTCPAKIFTGPIKK